ncbi:MAG: hypothetical protein SXG53_28015, partial [Pseudomonadota bacterium]|nr:hypothetical protein [Pseudomonadota bacterium]
MFAYIEAKEALKANLTYLSPGLAPYYWIVISLEFAAYHAATQLTGLSWWTTTIVVCCILMVACAFAVAQVCDLAEQTELAQIRVARIAGVATPFLSLALCMPKTRLYGPLFLITLAMTLLQSATFLFWVRETPLQKHESVNIPQLLIICTSLLFTSHALLGALATREFLVQLPRELHTGYGIKVPATPDPPGRTRCTDRSASPNCCWEMKAACWSRASRSCCRRDPPAAS